MKPKAVFRRISLVLFFTCTIQFAIASDPPPPPPDHGEAGNVPGGGAPLGSGLGILIACGAAYGSLKKIKTQFNQPSKK